MKGQRAALLVGVGAGRRDPLLRCSARPLKSRIVRVSFWSTFHDLQDERDRLVEYAAPEVGECCRQRKVEFVEVHCGEAVANRKRIEHPE